MAKITIYVPDQDPVKYGLGDQHQISIGRAEDCDIQLDHPSVSGHHATIQQGGGGMHVLVDNNSTNGIYLEGEKVTEAPLANGANFTIGSVPAEYEGDVAAAASATADEAPAASGAEYASAGGGGYGAPVSDIAENSTRPPGFTDLSPVEKVEKEDSMGKMAMIIGSVALGAAVLLIFFSVMMRVA